MKPKHIAIAVLAVVTFLVAACLRARGQEAPTQLAAKEVTLTVTWRPSDEPVTGYRVYWSPSLVALPNSTNVSLPEARITVPISQRTFFWVSAVRGVLEGESSEPVVFEGISRVTGVVIKEILATFLMDPTMPPAAPGEPAVQTSVDLLVPP